MLKRKDSTKIRPTAARTSSPRTFLEMRFNEWNALVSPDGRWIAYLSDESGRPEAYVQSFPVPGGKYPVTTGGANRVGWSPDGRRFAYGLSSDPSHGLDAELLGDSEFRPGPPRVFVTFPKDGRGLWADQWWKRLLVLFPAGKDPIPSITVMIDGLPGASRR